MDDADELATAAEAAGVAAFGALDVDRSALVRAVHAARGDGVTADTLRTHAAELYLGTACGAGSRAALATLDEVYIARVGAVVARRRLPAHAVDEIRQTVRERLLAGEPAYVARAAGRGALEGLVAVIATRAALDWLRAHARTAARDGGEPAADDLVASADPERDHLRARYRADLKTAFEAVVRDLEPRDRTMLRFHLVDGMTIDEIARLYQIHRATAARQIEKARDRVGSGVRKLLARGTGLPAGELRELAELVTSQLDLSLSRVLATRD
ncbi:MAG TPA: sigma factor-like helix-turn-helix DNA-binding protein [Kofleriaceae bacterium]|nr:sigma factor-like helix-turn-helix DNA-binding protein [Kofleriaceae bacterium]